MQADSRSLESDEKGRPASGAFPEAGDILQHVGTVPSTSHAVSHSNSPGQPAAATAPEPPALAYRGA